MFLSLCLNLISTVAELSFSLVLHFEFLDPTTLQQLSSTPCHEQKETVPNNVTFPKYCSKDIKLSDGYQNEFKT